MSGFGGIVPIYNDMFKCVRADIPRLSLIMRTLKVENGLIKMQKLAIRF